MTALAESGRSKLDVEISYSSSNQPHALSTIEFANSKLQESPIEPQLTRHHKPQLGPSHLSAQAHHYRPSEHEQRQAKGSVSTESRGAWSSKLRTVPLSIDFDISVFATQDRHGRLTLHPVLRAADFTSATTTPFQPQITSRAVAQSVVYRNSGCSSQQAGAESDLGRNNCAKASVNSHCLQFARNCGHHNQPSQQKMAETDISTATRASYSVAIGDTSESAAVPATTDASATVNRPLDSGVLAATNSNDLSIRRLEHAQQRCIVQKKDISSDRLSRDGNGSCCSSVSAPSPIKDEPPTRTQTHYLIGRSAGRYEANRSDMRFVQQSQETQQPQNMRCEDSQSAVPRYSVSGSSRTSRMTNFRLPVGEQYPFTMELVRVVHKLENLLDAINPRKHGSETASAPSITTAAKMASGTNCTRKGDNVSATAASGAYQGRNRPREPRSNIDVTNLRHEYVKLLRD